MQQKLKLSINKVFGILLLLVVLVLVRVFQEQLFYDPLLPFFQSSKKVLPDYNAVKLFLGLAFRYFLNSAISLGILWVAFKDKAVVKLSAILFFVFFMVLTLALYVMLNTKEPSLLAVFYVRRFLIQPLFLILFLPAFYYQKYMIQ